MARAKRVRRAFNLDEMETTFTIHATDRALVKVYSNDPVFQRKLERVGADVVEIAEDDEGKWYELPINQLRISMPPRRLSPEEVEKATERLRNIGKGRVSAE